MATIRQEIHFERLTADTCRIINSDGTSEIIGMILALELMWDLKSEGFREFIPSPPRRQGSYYFYREVPK